MRGRLRPPLLLLLLSLLPLVTPSQFPCGSSFTPCGGRAGGVLTNRIDDSAISLDRLESQDESLKADVKVSPSDVIQAAREAKIEVDTLFNATEARIAKEAGESTRRSADLSWQRLHSGDAYAKDLAYSAMLAEATSRRIVHSASFDRSQVAHSLPFVAVRNSAVEKACPIAVLSECAASRFRTYSGHCNNVRRLVQGAVYEPLRRLVDAHYADGVSAARISSTGEPLPSPIAVSTLLNPAPSGHASCTLLLAQWAAFLHDDMAATATNTISKGGAELPIPCCTAEHAECMPIRSAQTDACISYARTLPVARENCTLGPREQGNQVSSYLDASHIYGSHPDKAAKLRAFADGKLTLRSVGFGATKGLPQADDGETECRTRNSQQGCFLFGSPRGNLLPTSASLATIWMRQHNYIADELKKVNAAWDDERLFQEARRIVVAQIQHITYNEFVPIIVGKENLREFDLRLRRNGYSSAYDLGTDASTLNSYAASVSQFFLALLPSHFAQVNDAGGRSREEPVSRLLNDPSHLHSRGRLESFVRFLLSTPIEKPGLHMSLDLRRNFLKANDLHSTGLDIAAIIIQQGRDHGLSGYSTFRASCGFEKPRSFEELESIFLPSVNVSQVRSLYAAVDDIDLFIGGLAEAPIPGSLLGPTFACLFARQMRNVKLGDRFWYENFFHPSAFTAQQLTEIRKTSMARIICDNTERVGKVQSNVFALADDYGNCPMSCDSAIIDRLDFTAWADAHPHVKLPITKETLKKAIRLGAEQYRRLREAEGRRISANGPSPSSRSSSALFSHASLMAPKRQSLHIAEAAGVLRETTTILLDGNGLSSGERLPASLDRATLQRLLPEVDVVRIVGNFTDFLGGPQTAEECLPKPLPCDHTSKYRTYSGWCNNLKFPSYGNAFEPMRRLLPPAYDDGFDSPRTLSKTNRPLPSARRISNALHQDAPQFHVKFTHLLMQFGQVLDHDMMHSPIARGPGNTILNCSSCDSARTLSVHCFPIPIERGDPHFPATHSDGSPRCMPFARSLLGQLTLGYRNQMNQLTSYLDASYIYGSSECEANRLRLFSQGRLNFTDLGFNKEALPQGFQERDCRSLPAKKCFVAGDERSNEHPALTVIHTIYLREHNRIAAALHELNNFWTDEQLFQESRRIMIAQLQHIVFSEWLPVVLGCETMEKYGLTPKKQGYYNGYDARCDATMSQEMSTAAFRFGHTLIRAQFPRMKPNVTNDMQQDIELKETFQNPSPYYDKEAGHMESILMGLVGVPSMAFDRHIVNAVRNHLFQRPGGPLTGLDLAAVNIQRARDHGVPGYNNYRAVCGLARARSFDDLLTEMDANTVEAFKSVYNHVDDIDLFPGIMSERAIKGALVGPTLACLIAEQMQRLKKCDRFYYENEDPMTRFTPDQLAEIRKSSMARVICANSEYAGRIQPNAFLMPDDLTNAPITCSEHAKMDLTPWLDRKFCVVDNRVINLGKTKRITPCITCTCTAEGAECHSVVVERCETLLNEYLFTEIAADTVCVLQCASLIKQRAGRL